MRTKTTQRTDATPAGNLAEAQLHRVLGYQLAQATISTTAVYMQAVGQPFGLRPVEYTILSLINQNPGGSPAQLAKALAVTAPNITMWIDRLEEQGWVVRRRDENDKRAFQLRLTPRGATLVAKATEELLAGEQQAFAGLSDGERAILIELLHKVACARTPRP
ncbi:MAG TPA: MarR family transcriptional regulator [Albitalea sp.]|nr:MarR family transcriptional regulator [Albitalea sp.]